MAMQKRMRVGHRDVFPSGAYLVGAVEAVADFNSSAREDGSRPQQRDKDTGLPVWSVPVLDADELAGKREKTVTIKLLAEVQPVPPKNETPFPFTPVEFVGLTALPYIDDSGNRPRIVWSYRADGMTTPGGTKGSRAEAAA